MTLWMGDIVEFTAQVSIGNRYRALDVVLLRRAPPRTGVVVSLKEHFGFIRMPRDRSGPEKGKGKVKGSPRTTEKVGGKEDANLYFSKQEVCLADGEEPLRVGDTVSFRLGMSTGGSGKGGHKESLRAMQVELVRRKPPKGKARLHEEAMPVGKRLNLLLRKSGVGVGFSRATRQAQGPDGTLGFPAGWRSALTDVRAAE